MNKQIQSLFERIVIALAMIPMAGVIYGGLALQPAMAQIEEIVVTARKREESLLEIPFAISAFSAADLETANLKDFTDVQRFTPGLTFQNATANRGDRGTPNIIIRGLNIASPGASSEAALFFIDGAPVFGGEVGSFIDIERVEVLRGPQTAYFGRNTFSGAINLITKDPSEEFGGTVGLEYGKFGTNDLQLSVEGPLVPDALSFRLSGRRNEKGGQYINNFNGKREIGEELTQSVVGTLVATPRENVKLKLRGHFNQVDDGPSKNFKFGNSFKNCDLNGDGNNTWFCGEPPGVDVVESVIGFQDGFNPAYFNNINYFRNVVLPFSLFSPTGRPVTDSEVFIEKMGLAKRVEGVTFQGSVDLARGMTFDWISGYDKTRASIVSDENTLPRDGLISGAPLYNGTGDIFLVERFARNSSHEGRITSGDDQRLRWLVGASLVSGEVVSSCVAGISGGGPRGFTCRPILETETLGAFGGVYYDLTEQLTLSAEVRLQNDEVTIPSSGDTTDFDDTGGRLTLEFAPNEDLMYFVNYSRGFRPGSFNSIFAVLSPTEQASLRANSGAGFDIEPETLDQFEVGVKGGFLGGRLQGSVVAYLGQITDQQQTTVTSYVDDGGVTQLITVITNVGEVDLHGLELEGAFQATDEWTLQATFGWNHTEFTKGTCRACVVNIGQSSETDFLGNQTPWTPEFTASAVATYERPMFDGTYDGFVRGELLYESTKYATEVNLFETGARQIFNLRAGVKKDPYRIEAYITNVFDDDTYYYTSRQTDLDNFLPAFNVGLPDKRAYGVRMTIDF